MNTIKRYYITGLVWDGYKYEKEVIAFGSDWKKIADEFQSKTLHIDMPRIEMYEEICEVENGLIQNVVKTKFIDMRVK